MTMTLIQSQTLGADAASITFSSIPQTYKTLFVVMSLRGTSSRNLFIQFNGSATGFTWRQLQGTGATVASYNGATNQYAIPDMPNSTDTASTFGSAELMIPNYSGSANKAYSGNGVTESNAATAYQELVAGLWSNTAAITSFTVLPTSGNLATNSSMSLYGIS